MRKTLSVFIAVVMLFAACLPAGAIQLDAVESTAEPTAALAEEAGAELQGDSSDPDYYMPGLNLITGSNSLVTFGNQSDLDYFILKGGNLGTAWQKYPVEEFEVQGVIENGALASKVTSGGTTRRTNRINIPLVVETQSDRNYFFTAYITDTSDASHVGYTFNGVDGSLGSVIPDRNYFNTPWNNNKGEYRKTFTAPRAEITDGNEMVICFVQYVAGSAFNITVDNIGLFPYYKMNFYDYDGTLIDTVQVLFESGADAEFENIITEYNPNEAGIEATQEVGGKSFAGWIDFVEGTYEDYAEKISESGDSYVLDNYDMDFYPVYASPEEIKYTVEVSAATKGGTVSGADKYSAGSTVTLTATPDSGYEFLGWYDGEELVSTDATYTFTAEANVALVAKFQVIGFYQGTAGKPGLNLINGTNQAYDFDDGESPTFLWEDNNNYSIEMKAVNGNYWFVFHGANPSYLKYKDLAFVQDRKYFITFDYMSTGDVYAKFYQGSDLGNGITYNQGGELGGYYGDYGLSFTATGSTGNNFFYVTGSGATDFYIDNFAVVPYYNVTFKNLDESEIATKQVLFGNADANPSALKEKKIADVLTAYDPSTANVDVTAPEGKMLYGWSTEKGGEAMTSIPLKYEDIILYPVFVDAPEIPNAASGAAIRFGSNSGIRFSTTVTFETQITDGLEEYGFITAAKKVLEAASEELTLEFEKIVKGVAYNAKNGTNIYYAQDDGTGDKTVTAVLVGINAENTNHVNTKFVIRPYMIIKTALGYAKLYGNTAEASYVDAAKAIKANTEVYNALSEANKTFVENIIDREVAE